MFVKIQIIPGLTADAKKYFGGHIFSLSLLIHPGLNRSTAPSSRASFHPHNSDRIPYGERQVWSIHKISSASLTRDGTGSAWPFHCGRLGPSTRFRSDG